MSLAQCHRFVQIPALDYPLALPRLVHNSPFSDMRRLWFIDAVLRYKPDVLVIFWKFSEEVGGGAFFSCSGLENRVRETVPWV